jgi:hypothetical protein
VVVPLTPLIRDILEGAGRPLTLSALRQLILTTGVMLETPELSSAMLKLLAANRVSRSKVKSTGLGPGWVWAYEWKKP